MKKIYNGLLVTTSNGEENDLLGLMQDDTSSWLTHILAETIEDDMYNGKYLTVIYYISDKKLKKSELIREFILSLYGEGSAKYNVHYSDITGYLWTDENIIVGGHNLLEELRTNIGKWLYMEIEYSKEPIYGITGITY